MSNRLKLNIYDIVGSPIWISTEDGQKVYEKIVGALNAGKVVELSFARYNVLITAFLNAAVGQLYNGDFSEDFLKEHLKFLDIADDDRVMLERSIENAKRYFTNRHLYDQAWKSVVNESDE